MAVVDVAVVEGEAVRVAAREQGGSEREWEVNYTDQGCVLYEKLNECLGSGYPRTPWKLPDASLGQPASRQRSTVIVGTL